MRGVETRIQEIRHRIFREVARICLLYTSTNTRTPDGYYVDGNGAWIQ